MNITKLIYFAITTTCFALAFSLDDIALRILFFGLALAYYFGYNEEL